MTLVQLHSSASAHHRHIGVAQRRVRVWNLDSECLSVHFDMGVIDVAGQSFHPSEGTVGSADG